VVVLMLVLMFVNSGNYGLTLNQLRYGEAGLGRAVVYYVVSSILVYTVGVFIVSMGRRSWKASLQKLARVPAVYAVAAAVLVYSFALPVPSPVMRAIEITADGAIPAMLVVLGMNLADLDSFANFRFAAFATSIRLLGGPLVAFAITETLGLQGLSRATSIIEASMPTAVMTTVIATEFDVRPPLVTSVVILTTLASPFTLAFFISALNL
jgi:predicted permease